MMHDDTAQWRALIRQQRQCVTAAQLERARRVGSTPDPATTRGAAPINLRFRPDGAAVTQRHAAWRIPADHPGAHRLDQLHAGGHLDARLYANACAVLAIWCATGWAGVPVSDFQPRERATGDGDVDQQTAKDKWLALLARYTGAAKVDLEMALMVIRCEAIPSGDMVYTFGRACRALDRLDWLTAEWDGEMLRHE
jgi:hypothetical protein